MYVTELFDLAEDGAIEEWRGNLQEYKRLLPLGNDILNNNKAPLTSIIQLIPEEVDTLSISGFWLIKFPSVRVVNESVCVRKIQMGLRRSYLEDCVSLRTPTVILHTQKKKRLNTETSSSSSS